MSTCYYRLHQPITRIDTHEGMFENSTAFSVWANDTWMATLTISNEFKWYLLPELKSKEIAFEKHYGGDNMGMVVCDFAKDLLDEAQVISECGDIVTLGELRQKV